MLCTIFSGRWNRYSSVSLFSINACLSHEHEAGKGNLSLSSALQVITANSAENTNVKRNNYSVYILISISQISNKNNSHDFRCD